MSVTAAKSCRFLLNTFLDPRLLYEKWQLEPGIVMTSLELSSTTAGTQIIAPYLRCASMKWLHNRIVPAPESDTTVSATFLTRMFAPFHVIRFVSLEFANSHPSAAPPA